MSGLERKLQRFPDVDEGLDQIGDVRFAVTRRRSDAQALRSDRDRRIVDRLNVDVVPAQQQIARRLAALCVADHQRHDMRRVLEHRQASRAQSVLRDSRHVLMAVTFDADSFRCRIAAQAPAVTMGGRVVVKMNCGA